ncbi:hypothetical protein Hanom_Chr16g01459321 [Helianthus anomalus]
MLPLGYMTLYAAFFREGNFRLPMMKFIGEVLTRYGLHISQINANGLLRVTHFEFIFRAQRLVPAVDMFNVFYYVTYTGGSFNYRTANVLPCSKDPPKSFHDWKNKFFYIRRGVIPIDMHYRSEGEGVPKMVIGDSYADRDLYKTLTRVPTAIFQLEEKALVATGGYIVMNVLDPEVGGEITARLLPEGDKPWVDQIRDNFLHPSSESLNAYIATPLGACLPVSIKPQVGKPPARDEAILLSSEESTGSSHGLIHRSTRAGQRARPAQASGGDAASNPPTAEPKVATVEPELKEP